MSKTQSEYTTELRHDLHGETVGIVHTTPILVCDYCGATIDTTEPVMYDAIRIADMPHLTTLLDPPQEWVLDTARCRDCEIERLDPATEGYDEALVVLTVHDADGIQSVDTTTLTVVDLSLAGDGYYPPLSWAHTLTETDDHGHARWLRMQAHLEELKTAPDAPPAAVDMLQDIIKRSQDIPPGIDV
jgi:hypothetical protein